MNDPGGMMYGESILKDAGGTSTRFFYPAGMQREAEDLGMGLGRRTTLYGLC